MSKMLNILPFVGQVLLLAVLLTVLLGRFVKDSRQRMVVVAVLLASGLFIPIHGLSIAQWLRSTLGDLSIITLVVFSNILAQRLFKYRLLAPTTLNSLLLGVALAGVVFYPLALGVSEFDPYQLGYAPVWMSALLCIASIIAWLTAMRGLAIILLLPLLAFNLHLLESYNLWDYLLDPILLIYALIQGLLNSRFIRSKNTGGQHEKAAFGNRQ
jgi:hypothetical protein